MTEKILVKDAVRVVLKEKGKKLHLFMLDLDDETFRKVMRESKRLKREPAELLREVILKWLNRKNER